jgi:hypothetical protein
VLKLIESVFDVPAVAARETSTDVGDLLDVLDGSNYQPDVPELPNPGYVFPSSFCLSSINASGSSTVAELPAIAEPGANRAEPLARRDDEPTIFLKMIANGMLDGFPGDASHGRVRRR